MRSVREKVWVRVGTMLVVALALLGATGRAAAGSPWDREVVIGASASAGFMISEPFGGTNTLKCRLEYYLDSAVSEREEPVRNLATAFFFLNPEGYAQQQVDAALKWKPTLVVGVDFLFWYCYGDGLSDEARRQLFERGLKELEKFDCPVIVGDIPDASYATNSGIIVASQVPSPAVLKEVNRRLKSWVGEHKNVTLVPLAQLMAAVNAHKALTCHGQRVPCKASEPLIQGDHLHPTPYGAAWLTLEMLDDFTAKNGHGLAKDVCWNLETVLRNGTRLSQHPARARSEK